MSTTTLSVEIYPNNILRTQNVYILLTSYYTLMLLSLLDWVLFTVHHGFKRIGLIIYKTKALTFMNYLQLWLL